MPDEPRDITPVPQGMKFPRYAAFTMQQMADAGLNPFAAQLLAEAHADEVGRFRDETVLVVGRAHPGTPVFMLLSTRQPTPDQFATWPGADGTVPIEGTAVELEMVMVPRAMLGRAKEALKLDPDVDDPALIFFRQSAAADELARAMERPTAPAKVAS